MAAKPEHAVTINGVKIEYLSYGNNKITAGSGGMQISVKEIMDNYGKLVAPQAAKQGYSRVQIGSHGDFYHLGITKGIFVPLSTMYVARLLKK